MGKRLNCSWLLILVLTPLLLLAQNLRVNPTHEYIEYTDGRPFFYLGDTAWELFHRLNREEADFYLKNRAEKGFTVIQAVVLAELDGLNSPNAFGDRPLIDNDPGKPNEKYFEHVDYIVNKAEALGLFIGMLPTWGDKFNLADWGTGPLVFTPENAEIYGEWIASRYRDKPIIWILGGDRPPADEEDRQIIEALAKGIRKADKKNLMTYHPWGGTIATDFFPRAEWLDFDFYQSGHHKRRDPHYLIGFNEKSLAVNPKRPVINGEPNYEDHPVNWLRDGETGWFDDIDCRYAGYISMLSGACGHTYGNHNIWQMWEDGRAPISMARTQWKRALDYPGAFQMGYMRKLFESLPWQKLVSGETKILNDGSESFQIVRYSADRDFFVAYSADGSPISPDLTHLKTKQANAFWFNPRDAERKFIGKFETSKEQSFIPHSKGHGSDWILIVAGSDASFPVSQSNRLEWTMTSPDGAVLVTLSQPAGSGRLLNYTVKLKSGSQNSTAIEPSVLGIERNDQSFFKNLTFIKVEQEYISETYQLIAGKRKINQIDANEYRFEFTNENGQHLELIYRLFQDGVAFRYHFPQKDNEVHSVKKEYTSFNLPDDGKAWMLPYDSVGVWAPGYEAVFEKEISVGTPAPMTTGWGFPALFQVNDNWVLLTEAGLDETYCGTHLAAKSDEGNYTIDFPLETESYGLGSRNPQSTLPWSTPWRVIITGKTLGTIIESNMVLSLAEACKIEDTSWIKPGVCSWSWWGDHSSARDFNKLKDYVDLAANMGWEYSLVDAEWDFMEGGTLDELAEYAAAKNVGLFVWYNSGGPHNKANAMYRITPEILQQFLAKKIFTQLEIRKIDPLVNQYYFDDVPYLSDVEKTIGRKLTAEQKEEVLGLTFNPNATPRDRMHKKDVRRKEFARLQKMGIKGVKIDFFNSDKQDIIKLYLDIARDAADFGIMVNTHGCTIPRGWQRTWPNYISMEGVRGAELYSVETYPARAVWLNALYPYTRNVPGPMDYTPVTFDDYSPHTAHITTNAHELALSVIFECGVQHFADRKESYEAQPDFIQNHLAEVPVAWDETVFIDGYPGKYIILARRKGNEWYLAGINGEMRAHTFTFRLPFESGDDREITVITDNGKPREWQKYTCKIPESGVISIDILPAGGFVGKLKIH